MGWFDGKKEVPKLGGQAGVAQAAITGRQTALDAAEEAAMGGRTKQNQDAADGKTRLTTDDKKYK